MSGEVSYFSRFFVKFVEIIGAGLASAICAFVLAHFGGIRPFSPTPVSAPVLSTVQVGPTTNDLLASPPYLLTPPIAPAAVGESHPAPQQDTDAAIAQPASKAVKDAKTLRPRKHTKTDPSMTETKPPGQKSAEAVARAALANVDANKPAPPDSPIGPALTDPRPARAEVQPRPARAEVQPRPAPAEFQPRPAPAEVQPRPAEVRPPDVPQRQGEVQARSGDFPPRPPMPVGTPAHE